MTAESRRFSRRSRPSGTRIDRPVNSLPDTVCYPAQIGSEFKMTGFIDDIPEVNFKPELDYSKRELKKACKVVPLVGWKRRSKKRKTVFYCSKTRMRSQ